MGQVTVTYTTAGRTTTMELKGDPFEILAAVGCKMFPDADHSSTARLPAWDAYQRRLMLEAKKK